MTTHNTTDSKQLRLAVGSLLDIVKELVIALQNGDKPDEVFVDVTVEVIQQHRKDLGFHD